MCQTATLARQEIAELRKEIKELREKLELLIWEKENKERGNG